MYKRFNKRIIIFLIISIVLFIVAFFYFSFQTEVLNKYNSLKNGKLYSANVLELDGHDYSNADRPNFWRYTFYFDGDYYTSTTLGEYSRNQMDLMKDAKGQILIKYILTDNKIVLETEDSVNLNGIEYLIPVSCEAEYFNISRPPSLTASIFIFTLAVLSLIYVVINLFIVRFYKSIEMRGYDSYAIFVEAYSSKFGTNRYMAVRYKYQDDLGEWVEAVSPYVYHPMNIEIFKNLEAIKIRIKGKRSVITENTANIRQNRLT